MSKFKFDVGTKVYCHETRSWGFVSAQLKTGKESPNAYLVHTQEEVKVCFLENQLNGLREWKAVNNHRTEFHPFAEKKDYACLYWCEEEPDYLLMVQPNEIVFKNEFHNYYQISIKKWIRRMFGYSGRCEWL